MYILRKKNKKIITFILNKIKIINLSFIKKILKL